MRSVITISREFGSGGKEIGQKLAEKLGVPFYDKELLEQASKHSGICEDLFYKHDETYSGSLLYSLVMGAYPTTSDGKLYPDMPLNHKIFLAQFETIRKLAAEGPCVIIGRCADYVLAETCETIDIFVYGDMADKKKRILERYDIEKNKCEDFIKKTDKRRAGYYNYYTDRKWGVAAHYDLCVNSSRLGIDGTVKLLMDYIKLHDEA